MPFHPSRWLPKRAPHEALVASQSAPRQSKDRSARKYSRRARCQPGAWRDHCRSTSPYRLLISSHQWRREAACPSHRRTGPAVPDKTPRRQDPHRKVVADRENLSATFHPAPPSTLVRSGRLSSAWFFVRTPDDATTLLLVLTHLPEGSVHEEVLDVQQWERRVLSGRRVGRRLPISATSQRRSSRPLPRGCLLWQKYSSRRLRPHHWDGNGAHSQAGG